MSQMLDIVLFIRMSDMVNLCQQLAKQVKEERPDSTLHVKLNRIGQACEKVIKEIKDGQLQD